MNYTGCQTLWSSINGARAVRSVTYFKAGQVVAVEPLPDGVPLCKPDQSAATAECTPRREVVLVSFPPGCEARTLSQGTVPEDCMKSFEAEFKLHDQIRD